MHLSVERLGSYPQTHHDSLDPISADGACVTKQCKGTYKQFVVFQSSFQHCFHLKFHLSTLAGTSALRGWTKLGLGDRPTPGGAHSSRVGFAVTAFTCKLAFGELGPDLVGMVGNLF